MTCISSAPARRSSRAATRPTCPRCTRAWRRWPRCWTGRAWSSASPPCRSAPRGRLAAELSHACPGAELAWNPEFLREGSAVADTLSPDRIVVGVTSGPGRADPPAGLRPAARGRHRVHRHHAGDRRAGQGGRQRVPGHEDLVHQRDGRDLRGRRGRRARAGADHRRRPAHRPGVPARRARLRRRLPAEGHPGVRGPRRGARRRRLARLPARGRRDQPAAPRPHRRPHPASWRAGT